MPVRLYCCTVKSAGLIPPEPELAPDAPEWSAITADWYGKKLVCQLQYRLELYRLQSGAPDLLAARFKLPILPAKRHDAIPGAFVEGLWNYDAAELFLLDKAGAPYLELNLSPYGEWWGCRFTGFRTDRTPLPQLGVKAAARILDDGWEGELYLPAAALESGGINLAGLKLHVAAILGPGADRRYLSSKPVIGIDPDFHRAEVFEEAEPVVVGK